MLKIKLSLGIALMCYCIVDCFDNEIAIKICAITGIVAAWILIVEVIYWALVHEGVVEAKLTNELLIIALSLTVIPALVIFFVIAICIIYYVISGGRLSYGSHSSPHPHYRRGTTVHTQNGEHYRRGTWVDGKK
jgi:hypothetical protein